MCLLDSVEMMSGCVWFVWAEGGLFAELRAGELAELVSTLQIAGCMYSPAL